MLHNFGLTASRLLMATCVVFGLLMSLDSHAKSQPNVVFILSDDEDLKSHAFMPKTKALLHAHGAVFDNYFVTASLCCPSRTSILRGQYPHNTKIQGNAPPEGGFERFRALGLEQSNVATWLQGAGYRTAYFGKFMNGYRADSHGVLPGWDEWYGSGNGFRNYNYTLNENGALVAYGDDPKDYLTDVRKAAGVIRRADRVGQPFFLYISPFTPHTPATWAPRHANLFTDAKLPRPPSFNETDITEKPPYVRERALLSAGQVTTIETLYQRRLRSLQATDDLVEALIETLKATGQLDNTYIVYTSDNGFRMGEHRLLPGKDTAYEEDIRVPLIVRGPRVPPGARIEPMVLNTDLAPTLAQIAGAKPPDFVDGRSFLPLLRDPEQPWRRAFMVGRLQYQGLEQAERAGKIRFKALRTHRWAYVEYAGHRERELYDLQRDPYQLDNLAQEARPALLRALSSRLAGLSRCKASVCRRLENAPLPF
ncbi:MAG: sulfatase family protein [Gammaproteobacteria bacterium]